MGLDQQVRYGPARWATPRAEDAESAGRRVERGTADTLTAQVREMWPTPKVMDAERSSLQTQAKYVARTGRQTNLRAAVGMSLWPTPRTPTGGAESAGRKQELGRDASGGGDLTSEVRRWPTPIHGCAEASHGQISGQYRDAMTAAGVPAGRLNPRWVEVLMRVPVGWCLPSCSYPWTPGPTS
jgi:hypothetical protein